MKTHVEHPDHVLVSNHEHTQSLDHEEHVMITPQRPLIDFNSLAKQQQLLSPPIHTQKTQVLPLTAYLPDVGRTAGPMPGVITHPSAAASTAAGYGPVPFSYQAYNEGGSSHNRSTNTAAAGAGVPVGLAPGTYPDTASSMPSRGGMSLGLAPGTAGGVPPNILPLGSSSVPALSSAPASLDAPSKQTYAPYSMIAPALPVDGQFAALPPPLAPSVSSKSTHSYFDNMKGTSALPPPPPPPNRSQSFPAAYQTHKPLAASYLLPVQQPLPQYTAHPGSLIPNIELQKYPDMTSMINSNSNVAVSLVESTFVDHKVCSVCGKRISRDMSRHMRIHQTVSRFHCKFPKDVCSHKSGKFNRPYDYKKHLLNRHFKFDDPEIKKLHNLNDKLDYLGTCPCGARYVSKDWLENHVLTEDESKKCPLID